MKLTSAILIVASTMAASEAHAGPTSATMGVGLTIVAECRASNCARAPALAAPARILWTDRGANSPNYATRRPAKTGSPETLTMTY